MIRRLSDIRVIFAVFLILRVLYLLTFPLFSDESIYIRWGRLMLYLPHEHWASLAAHGKPPLLYWLFGLAVDLTGSVEIGPRLVSLLAATITFWLLHRWIVAIADRHAAAWACGFLAITPMFVHFQTLAMMESFVIFHTVWIFFLLSMYRKTGHAKYLVFLGLAMGIGNWFKATTLMATGVVFLLSVSAALMRRNRLHAVMSVSLLPVVAFLIAIPLIMRPEFAAVASNQEVFTLTAGEFISFPFHLWTSNTLHAAGSLMLYGCAGLVIASLWMTVNRQIGPERIFTISFLVLMLIPILLNKVMSVRYYISAIPLLLPVTGIWYSRFMVRAAHRWAGFTLLAVGTGLSLLMISSPPVYFSLFPASSERNYGIGWTSGYATREATKYLDTNKHSLGSPAGLAVHDISGNPSEYVLAKYFTDESYTVVFLNSKNQLSMIKKRKSSVPVYFVSRSSDPLYREFGNLELVKSFASPGSDDAVSIWRL
jgi:4-amino-4-deoxy-L-arabinose transferase-like glycosyltransferase